MPPEMGFHRYPDGWESARGKRRVCVNPLSWTLDGGHSPATSHAGALPGSIVPLTVDPDGCEMGAILPQHTWAECHEGRLWVADQSGSAFHDFLGVYHLFDFTLFWMNIRQNACARAEALLAARSPMS
jgi:hypothetical protein